MIRGEKVDLVPPSLDLVRTYMRWVNDPDVSDMLGDARFPLSEASEREWLEDHLSGKSEEVVFTIQTKKGLPIGNTGLHRLNYQNGCANLGIMIGEKAYWDKSYGADTIRTMLRYAFEELGLRKVELGVHSLNSRAIACYRKCGFLLEGTLRMHDHYRGGYCDSLIMGILKEEWQALERKRRNR